MAIEIPHQNLIIVDVVGFSILIILIYLWIKIRQNNKSFNHSVANNELIQNVSLVLVFGKTNKPNIYDLDGKTEISTENCNTLKKYEWFWYGKQNASPVDDSDENSGGNMFWLQMDFSMNTPKSIRTHIDISDLLDEIVKKNIRLEAITVGGPFDYNSLSSKGFLRV